MNASIKYRLEQAKRLLFSLSAYNSFLPIIYFAGVTIMLSFVYAWKLGWLNLSNEEASMIDYKIRLFIDGSLLAIIMMLINAKHYKWLSWLCWCCLFVIWALNLFYVSMDYECDFYYAAYIIVIYFTFVVIVVGKILIRC